MSKNGEQMHSFARKAARLLEGKCGSGQRCLPHSKAAWLFLPPPAAGGAAKFCASPVRYRSSCKPPLTKILLADTPLAVTNVFKASGFGCLRRFNDLFKKQYRQPPTILRKQAMLACSTDLTAYNAAVGLPKQPYPWLQVIGSLSARSISVVDTASDDACISTVQHVDDAQVSASGQGSTSTCVR